MGRFDVSRSCCHVCNNDNLTNFIDGFDGSFDPEWDSVDTPDLFIPFGASAAHLSTSGAYYSALTNGQFDVRRHTRLEQDVTFNFDSGVENCRLTMGLAGSSSDFMTIEALSDSDVVKRDGYSTGVVSIAHTFDGPATSVHHLKLRMDLVNTSPIEFDCQLVITNSHNIATTVETWTESSSFPLQNLCDITHGFELFSSEAAPSIRSNSYGFVVT